MSAQSSSFNVTTAFFIVSAMAALFFCSAASIGAFADSPEGWTPRGMITFKNIGTTAVSPDGSLVAYTVSEPRTEGETSSYLTHVWIASADGSMNRRFTSGDHSCLSPSFSPAGGYLAFVSGRDGDGSQIWIIPLDGGEAERVTSAEKSVGAYAWSPDGARMAYTMTDPDTEEDKRAKRERLDMRVVDEDYKYSHIYTIPVMPDASGQRSPVKVTSGPLHVTAFDWSPDSASIVFAHQETPSADVWSTTDISVVPSNGGTARPLIRRPGADRYPKYSPDGKNIAFPSDAGELNWPLLSDAYIVPAGGGVPRKLAETPDRNFMYYGRFLGWSGDGRDIYVQEADRTSWRVYAIPSDGGKPRIVTPGPGNYTGISFSADGSTMAFIHEASETPPQLYITGTRKFAPKQLSNINAEYLSHPLGRTETIRWKSSDGIEIEGLLTTPVGYREGRRCPLILLIHGGPASVHADIYTAKGGMYPIQAFAQAGYAVLRVNPRGSSGYGRDFRYANHNDWGFGDFDDQMTGVDRVIEMGVAHPDSLCVTGWSYGGYMTSFIVTRTGRFKAAMMGAGISNLASFTGTADIPSFIPDYFDGEPWERTEAYVRHSAVFQAKGVTTPTLILHGELDRRVPLSQGEEFYNALRRQGCATRMVVYPRTYHSPSEPKFIVDIGERIIDWFDTHLGRKPGE